MYSSMVASTRLSSNEWFGTLPQCCEDVSSFLGNGYDRAREMCHIDKDIGNDGAIMVIIASMMIVVIASSGVPTNLITSSIGLLLQ